MKRVLLMAYNFPPMGGGGVQRVAKFVKYLPDFGWEPVVLTTDDRLYWARDETLIEEIPRGTVIRRLSPKSPQFLYSLLHKITSERISHMVWDSIFLPDDRVLWALTAALRAVPMLKREGISLIYSTSPPHSTHLGALIIKMITKIPWAADFRDPWTSAFGYAAPNRLARSISERIEKMIINGADRITTVSEPIKKQYVSLYRVDPQKVVIIPNGFDEDDFGDPPPPERREEISLTYCGSLYGSHDACIFFSALSLGLKRYPALKKKLIVRMVGVMDPRIREEIESLLGKSVSFTGYVAHAEAIRAMRETDINLLLIPMTDRSSYIVSGKIFEYLASGRPILAFAPPGEASRLIADTRTGIVIGNAGRETLSDEIYRAIMALKEKGGLSRDSELIGQFERKKLTGRLARVFEELIVEEEK